MDIVIRGLCKGYGETRVLTDFSCRIAQGSSCAVLAPSGAGKTTLLRLILGLEKPDAGEILGVPAQKAAVFQEDRLLPGRSALDNLRMAVPITREQGQEMLSALGLGDVGEKCVRELSGGQARRVALARALLPEGGLLALDEPFTGLDDTARRLAAQTILRCRRGRTLLLITHRMEDLSLLKIQQEIQL